MSIFDEIKLFSAELEKALEININDYDYPGGFDIQWHTNELVIYLRNRYHDSWYFLLEVIPRMDLGHNCYLDSHNCYLDTWDLTNYMEQYNENWHYRFRGTSTENLPKQGIRDFILIRIRQAYLTKDIKIYRENDSSTQYQDIKNHNNIIEKIESRFEILDL